MANGLNSDAPEDYSSTHRSTEARFEGDGATVDTSWNPESGMDDQFDFLDAEYMESFDWDSLTLLYESLVDSGRGNPEPISSSAWDSSVPAADIPDTSRAATPVRWFADIPIPAPTILSERGVGSKPLSSAASDAAYRDMVQRQLEPAPQQATVPSTQTLSHCVRLYLDKCQPLLPIVHASSFRTSESNALLMFAIATLGTQLVGLPGLAERGERMFLSMHRAILSSWMSMIHGSHEAVPLMQAVVLGQAYAMLSPNPAHFVTAQAFQGTLVLCYERVQKKLEDFLARRQQSPVTLTLEEQWQLWATEQSLIRVQHALKILDAELSLLGHTRPQTRSGIISISTAEDRAFTARTEKQWQEVRAYNPVVESRRHDSSNCHSGSRAPQHVDDDNAVCSQYAQLANILTRLCERRLLMLSIFDSTDVEVETELVAWLERSARTIATQQSRHLRLDCLWHSGWLAILCDIDLLEIACKRDGPYKAQQARERVATWVSSEHAQRAIIHAYKIQQQGLSMTLSDAAALHVPRALYQAGLVLFCMSKSNNESQVPFRFDWAQLLLHRDMKVLRTTQRFHADDKKNLEQDFATASGLREQACVNASILRRLWPWGIAGRLASTLSDLLKE